MVSQRPKIDYKFKEISRFFCNAPKMVLRSRRLLLVIPTYQPIGRTISCWCSCSCTLETMKCFECFLPRSRDVGPEPACFAALLRTLAHTCSERLFDWLANTQIVNWTSVATGSHPTFQCQSCGRWSMKLRHLALASDSGAL